MRDVMFILGAIILVYIVGYMIYVSLRNRREQRYINEGHELASRLPADDGSVSKARKLFRQDTREEPGFDAPVTSTDTFTLQKNDNQPDVKPVDKIWSNYYQFNIVSRDHRPFTFEQLKSVFMQQGMIYGKYDILYFYDKQNNGKELFRIGSMIKPGTFPKGITGQGPADPNWSTKGICVIMFLTEPGKAEERFDRILNSINAISSSLDGLLCTKNLTPFTDDVIAEYRRQLNAYDHQ